MGLHVGSLGPIEKSIEGYLYTTEDSGYSTRYWFETEKEAKDFITECNNDKEFHNGGYYFQDGRGKVEPARSEFTVLVLFDPVTHRMRHWN